jgi:hypothetical protein
MINLYCFWMGKDRMNENRNKCYLSLKNSELNIILITPDNLDEYIIEPLHIGFKYLSEVHKSDYLRSYFMYFHGGGYSDIKYTNKSWVDSINMLHLNNDILVVGYKELIYGVPKIEDDNINNLCQTNWHKLIGNDAYIFKKKTVIADEWYKKTQQKMDEKYSELVKFPSKNIRQIYTDEYKYPFRWAELLGEIFHPIIYKYNNMISQILPPPSFENYN